MSPQKAEVVIVGSGFSGIAMAILMKKAGMNDFVILEQAAEVGGTWRENHYPGAACDVPSPVYSFSFEPNPNWTRMFSPQQEIQSYLCHCADTYQLRNQIQFHSQVEAAEFEPKSGLWTVALKGGKTLLCRFLIIGTGGLSRPSFPDIQGLKEFQGPLFHTAQWRHDVPLTGAKVAVIGTGASAIQVVPQLANHVGHLSLFQRTPAWIVPKSDRAFSASEKTWMKNIPALNWLRRQAIYWQFEARGIVLLKPKLMQIAQKMALDFLKEEVADPVLRQKLRPRYIMGCKRILLSNDFYATLNRTHVETITQPIDRITAKGIRTTDGQEHAVDAIVCATGFQVAEATAPFRIVGRSGQVLSELWKDGAQAYLGTSIAGFPNLFYITGPNSGLGHNSMVFMIESHVRYIIQALSIAQKKKLKSLEVKESIQATYNEALQKRFAHTVWAKDNCVSWYQNASGRNSTLWPGLSFSFRLKTRKFDRSCYQEIPLNGQA